MPTKNSSTVTIRLDNKLIKTIKQRAGRRKWTTNYWFNRLVIHRLGNHTDTPETLCSERGGGLNANKVTGVGE